MTGRAGELIVGTGGSAGRPWTLCVAQAAALPTPAFLDITYYDTHGGAYDSDVMVPIDTTMRGMLGLFGLPGVSPLDFADTDQAIDDAAAQWYDRVMGCAGLVAFARRAPVNYGWFGTDNRKQPNYCEGPAVLVATLAENQGVCAGLVPENVRTSVAAYDNLAVLKDIRSLLEFQLFGTMFNKPSSVYPK